MPKVEWTFEELTVSVIEVQSRPRSVLTAERRHTEYDQRLFLQGPYGEFSLTVSGELPVRRHQKLAVLSASRDGQTWYYTRLATPEGLTYRLVDPAQIVPSVISRPWSMLLLIAVWAVIFYAFRTEPLFSGQRFAMLFWSGVSVFVASKLWFLPQRMRRRDEISRLGARMAAPI